MFFGERGGRVEAGLVDCNERYQKSGRFISFAYIQYITCEFVTGCSSTWHKLDIYIYINVDKDSIIPGGSKVRKLSFQVTKCYNHTLSQLGLVSQASRLGWFIGLEHPLISQASMTVANWTQCCWHYSLNPGAWKGAVAYWLERISNCMWKVTFFLNEFKRAEEFWSFCLPKLRTQHEHFHT